MKFDKVYILERCEDHEGGTVLGLFHDPIKAMESCKEIPPLDWEFNSLDRSWRYRESYSSCDSWYVYAMEVQ